MNIQSLSQTVLKLNMYIFIFITGKVGMTSPEHSVYHYLSEAAKFAVSNRMKLGDPDFNSKADVVSRSC